MNWGWARDTLRIWREENARRSLEVVGLWDAHLQSHIHKMGDERLLVWEQVCIAALDCNRMDVVDICLVSLASEFPSSTRVRKLQAMKLEALEKYDDALELLDQIIKRDETNAAPRKRRVAILKAKGRIVEAIKELNEYLKKFMSDQEAWQELCELYLMEQDFAKAAFCMEELILHNPHNHLIHQRYADIKYTQGGLENMEVARAHYSLTLKLNQNNMRALYGILLAATNVMSMAKSLPAPKKKECSNLIAWASKQIQTRYEEVPGRSADIQLEALNGMLGALQITASSS